MLRLYDDSVLGWGGGGGALVLHSMTTQSVGWGLFVLKLYDDTYNVVLGEGKHLHVNVMPWCRMWVCLVLAGVAPPPTLSACWCDVTTNP